MAKDRSADTPIIDGRRYGTWSIPPKNPLGLGNTNLLDGLPTTEHTFCRGERLDNLSFRYLNDPDYWWLIALVNNIAWPLGIAPGTVLKIPVDVKDVLDRIFRS